jgi:integrase
MTTSTRALLSDSIDAYMLHRSSQNYSKATLKADTQVLKKFLAITGNVYCHSITHRHVERHFEEVSKTRKPASLRNDHGVLVRFFKWARHTGRMPIDSDPMFGRRQPRPVKRERNRLHVTRFGELLEAAEERDPRDRALCALLLYTLGRDSEVTDLRIRDLDLQAGWLKVRIHKTGQEDTLPVSTELDSEMRRWLTHYTAVAAPLQPWFHLVPARGVFPIKDDRGRILKHESIYRPERKIGGAGRIVNPILEKIGFPVLDESGKPCGEGSHTIRRSGARALFDQLVEGGYDHALRLVQSMLHHASVTMTERYIGITADRRTRDDVIRGKMMYQQSSSENVLQMRVGQNGNRDRQEASV